MSTRTTVVLLALLILVAAVVYLIEFRKPGGAVATPVASESTTLLDVTMPAINGITIRDVASGTQIAATLDVSGTWWLSNPPNQPGDPMAFMSLASRLAYITVQRTLTPTTDLQEFGLAQPRLSVEISTDTGVQSFIVGDASPNGMAFYAAKPGDPHVYLIDGALVGQLQEFVRQPPVAAPPTLSPMVLTPAAP